MNRKLLMLLLLFYFSNTSLFGQDQIKSINFVLVIDGEVPISSISKGYYSIRDTNNVIIDKVPFVYKVGRLEFNIAEYNKIIKIPDKSSLWIEFEYIWQRFPIKMTFYETSIFLNKDFIIMDIYNKSKKENRRKYDFGEDKYVVRIRSSTWNTVMHYRSKSHAKLQSELH